MAWTGIEKIRWGRTIVPDGYDLCGMIKNMRF